MAGLPSLKSEPGEAEGAVVKKKKSTELHRLLARVDALPPEARAGIVKFLELVTSLESEFEGYVPPVLRSEDTEKDLRELRGILLTHLEGGPVARRGLVVEIFDCAEKAYALAQEDSARLLLQVGIVVAAGTEQLASFIVQNVACDAALEIVRAAAR